MATTTQLHIKVADEVWVATALLHREQPEQDDFAVEDIVARARQERLTPLLRPGVYVHVVQHCVANRVPNPGRYRMLLETGKNRRRLYRPGDPCDPAREGAKTVPDPEALPTAYRPLLVWYREQYARGPTADAPDDPLLALRGSGRQLWGEERPDDYVRRLREGWA